MRRYRSEDDYWRIRAFLREVYLLSDRRELSWQVARLDYWRWHGILNEGDGQLKTDVFLWEMVDGRLAGVLNREAAGQAYLQVDPRLRTAELEEEMIATAEAHLHTPRREHRAVAIWVDRTDDLRLEILRHRGYERGKWAAHQWWRDLRSPIADIRPTAGYRVRSLGDESELPGRTWASFRAFHPNDSEDQYGGWEWYLNVQSAPLYRRDLDLVVVTGDADAEQIVAFTTIWYDDATRSACFEPVGTMPEHQRRGLARAAMTEGLRRLQRLGATRASVHGYEPGANRLYASVLSPHHDVSEQWVKVV